MLIDGLFFQVVRELKNTDSRLDMKRFNRPVRIDVLLALYCQNVLAKLAKLDEEIFNED